MNRLNSSLPNTIFSLSYLNKWQEQMAFKVCGHCKVWRLYLWFYFNVEKEQHIPAGVWRAALGKLVSGNTLLWLVPLQPGHLFGFHRWSFPFCRRGKLSKLSSEAGLVFFCPGRKGSNNTGSTPPCPGLATVWMSGLPCPCPHAH